MGVLAVALVLSPARTQKLLLKRSAPTLSPPRDVSPSGMADLDHGRLSYMDLAGKVPLQRARKSEVSVGRVLHFYFQHGYGGLNASRR